MGVHSPDGKFQDALESGLLIVFFFFGIKQYIERANQGSQKQDTQKTNIKKKIITKIKSKYKKKEKD